MADAAEVIRRSKTGEKFSDLAKELSDDGRTKNDGGELGLIERGTIANEWEKIVFSMDKNDVRGPVRGPQGLHIFYVSQVVHAGQEKFEDVKNKIRNQLYQAEMAKQTGLWLDELRKKAHVVKL